MIRYTLAWQRPRHAHVRQCEMRHTSEFSGGSSPRTYEWWMTLSAWQCSATTAETADAMLAAHMTACHPGSHTQPALF